VVRPGRKIEPEPFQLQSDIRGEKHQKDFKEKVSLVFKLSANQHTAQSQI